MTNYDEHLKAWEKELIRRREVAYLMAATLYGARADDWAWSELETAAGEFYAAVYHVQMPPKPAFTLPEETEPPA